MGLMVARLVTVRQLWIRGFIDAARPGNSGLYDLQNMQFPPKQLTDSLQTIESAGLISAVVIQKTYL